MMIFDHTSIGGRRIVRIKGEDVAEVQIDDGGKKAAGIEDTNNCTVRALAICTGMDYKTCDITLTNLGRLPNRGWKMMQRYEELPVKFEKTDFPREAGPRPQVRTVLKKLKTGRHIVRIAGHVFAVVDGVIHDTFTPSMFKPVWSYITLCQPPSINQ